MECAVCCETFNKKEHSKTDCNFCDFSACKECVQQYLLSKINEPSCMNCNHEWNREFLDANLTKKFINSDLKKHREVLLFEKERCQLPAAQIWVAHENQRNDMKLEEESLRKMLEEKRNEVEQLSQMLHANNFDGSTIKRKFQRKCPYEGCKGFLSTQWKCDICTNWTCPECNEVKGQSRDADHTCDPANVETAKLLRKDTKPCPCCGILIFKISGCSQMWCTECNTAFDWNSGRIIEGRIHNPHFYEARRRAGISTRELGDIPCGGLPGRQELATALGIDNHRHNWSRQWPITLIDIVCDINGYEAPQRKNNHEQRVLFIKGEISEERFKNHLQRVERIYQRDREEYDIISMVGITVTDLLRQIVVDNSDYQNMYTSIREIIKYAQDSLYNLSKRYNLVVRHFISPQYKLDHYHFYGWIKTGKFNTFAPGSDNLLILAPDPTIYIAFHRQGIYTSSKRKTVNSRFILYDGEQEIVLSKINREGYVRVTTEQLYNYNKDRIISTVISTQGTYIHPSRLQPHIIHSAYYLI